MASTPPATAPKEPEARHSDKTSKFDVSLTFCSQDDSVSAVYHKHFREVKKVKITKQEATQGEDTLVIPMPSAFGLVSASSGLAHDLIHALGEELGVAIREHVFRKYLGEMPLGSCFLMRNPNKESKIRFLVVVAVFRALTVKEDDMAWLDPKFVTPDFAYNAMRSVLLAVLRHNARRPHVAIKNLYCPDFFALRKQSPQGEELGDKDLEETVIQLLLATKSVLVEPPKESADWTKAMLITTQIIQRGQATADDLEMMLSNGKLESRGLYKHDELTQVLLWARDPANPERREKAARVLAACLHRRDTQFNIAKAEVAKRISSVQEGCLPLILDMVLEGKITVHTEIPFHELTMTEKIGEGGAGSVWRGTWGTKHVAIKEFRKDIAYKEFIREISLNCVIEHENLVKSLGGVTKSGKMLIVQELMQANLADVLAEKSIALDSGIIVEIALQAAEGIWHLHSHCNLIHRDIKSQNLLLNTYNGRLEVKLGDFGVSRVINKKQVMTGNVGTVAWTAPEVFDGRRYNEKADVYSFGIILWEMCTREIPFVNLSSFAIPVLVIKGKRPDVPKHVKPKFKKLISLCWNQKPKARPEMNKMIESLRKLHSSLSPEEKTILRLDITPVFGVPGDNKYHKLEHVLTPRSESGPSGSETGSEHAAAEAFSDASAAAVTVTCDVPQPWTRHIADIEVSVNNVFSILQQDLDAGTIVVGEKSERFLVFRSNAFTIDFFEAASNAFKFDSEPSRVQFTQNLLFDLGFSVGKSEATRFFAATPVEDVAVRSNAALVHLSYLGMGWVSLSSDTKFTPDEFIITENRYSFESDSWKEVAGHSNQQCHCVLVAGFLAGWGRVAGGDKRAVSEVQCVARGDSTCTFIHCSKNSLEANVRSYSRELSLNNCDVSPFLSARTEAGEWLPQAFPTLEKRGWDTDANDKVLTGVEEPKWSEDDILDHAAEAMDNFFIDPTSATVELAEAKCILLRAQHLAHSFNIHLSALVQSLPASKFGDPKTLRSHFAFEWSRVMGKNNCDWFAHAIGMGDNKLERLFSLPTHLAYMGWSNLIFPTRMVPSDFRDHTKDFSFKIHVTDSFEVLAAELPTSEPKRKGSLNTSAKSASAAEDKRRSTSDCLDLIGRSPKCVCVMHSGFITGWCERALQVKCKAIETSCVARGDVQCEFTVMAAPVAIRHVGNASLASSSPIKSSHESKKRTDPLSKSDKPERSSEDSKKRNSSSDRVERADKDSSSSLKKSEKGDKEKEKADSPSVPGKSSDGGTGTGIRRENSVSTWKF